MTGRRRFSERLLLCVNVLAANAVAAVWVMAFLQPGVLGSGEAELAGGVRCLLVSLESPTAWISLLLAIGLLLWNFAYLVRRRDERVPDHWVVSQGPGGPVRVAREAVEAALRAAGESLPAVTRLRVVLQGGGPKRLRVVGQFHCAEAQDHLGCSRQLRERLNERFAELVRLGDGHRVDVELEFQGFAGKLAKGAEPVPVAAAEPFRGPQYPVDDDGEMSR